MSRKLPEKVFSEEDFVKVMKATKKVDHKLAFSLGFFCGLRISEVLKLKAVDVDLNRQMLFIRQGKGNKDRYVPIPKPIRKYLKHLPIKSARRTLQNAITGISMMVLDKKMTFHALRHGAATHYLKKGMNIREVQQLLGHADISATQIYTHISMDDVKDKMDEIWD